MGRLRHFGILFSGAILLAGCGRLGLDVLGSSDFTVQLGSITGTMEYAVLSVTVPTSGATNAEITPTGSGVVSTGSGFSATGTGDAGSGTGATTATATSSSGFTNILLNSAVSAPLTTDGQILTCDTGSLAATCSSGTLSFFTSALASLTAIPSLLVNGSVSVAVPASYYEVSQVSDINSGGSDGIAGFLEYNGELYFSAFYPATAWAKLHKLAADGTIQRLTNFQGAGTDSISATPAIYRGDMYFSALDSSGNSKLFKLDGTGTITQISDINTGASDDVSNLFVFNDSLYFGANTYLQRLDSSGVITQVTDFAAPIGAPATFKDEMYFSGTGAGGSKLFKLSSLGVITQISDTDSGGSDAPVNLFALGDYLYFTAANAAGFTKIYKTDSVGAVTLVTDLNGAANDVNSVLGVFNGALYFTSDYSTGFRKIFKVKTDGTVAQVSDLNSSAHDVPSSTAAVEYQGELYFTGWNSAGHTKLFKMNASEEVMQVTNILGDATDEDPSVMGVYNDALYVSAYASGTDRKIYKLVKKY